jgi:hypothetical protein
VPLLTNFTHPIPSTAVRTGDDEARLAEHHSRQAQLFLENADVFGAPFVLEELRSSRSKNTEEGKLQAQETIDSLSNQAPQTLSSIIVDQRGQIVVAYMGKRVKKPLGPKLSDNSEKAMRQRLLKRAKVTRLISSVFCLMKTPLAALQTVRGSDGQRRARGRRVHVRRR